MRRPQYLMLDIFRVQIIVKLLFLTLCEKEPSITLLSPLKNKLNSNLSRYLQLSADVIGLVMLDAGL